MNRLSIVLLCALTFLALPNVAAAQEAFGTGDEPKITLPGLTE